MESRPVVEITQILSRYQKIMVEEEPIHISQGVECLDW